MVTNRIIFSASRIQPNPNEIDYWVDLVANPYGGSIKYYNGTEWVPLSTSEEPSDLTNYYTKFQVNSLLNGKADVKDVDSKVDDDEVRDVIKDILFRTSDPNNTSLILLRYDNSIEIVNIPVASVSSAGVVTSEDFINFVKQNLLQELHTEMIDLLADIRVKYLKKLIAGRNITIDQDTNVISASGEFTPEWDKIINKPNFSTVATSGDYNDLINKLVAGDQVNISDDNVITIDVDFKEIQDNIASVDNKISIETDRAIKAESTLQSNIDTEASIARAAEKTNADNIVSLNTNLTNSINTVNTTLSNRITDVSLNLTSSVNTINNSINTVADNLSTEVTNRINSYDQLSKAIADEAITARSAEKANSDAIDKEITDRTNAIKSESDRALAAEKKVQDNLDAAVTSLENAIATELDRATTAESTIATNLSNEITRSTNKDTEHTNAINKEIQDRLDALATEVSDRNAAIKVESDRAKSAETALGTRIDSHTSEVAAALLLKADKSDTYTKSQVDAKVSGVYKVKGSRAFEDLPSTGNIVGDVYNITNNFTLDGHPYKEGTNVVWTDEGWDPLSGIFDMSTAEGDVQQVADALAQEILDRTQADTVINQSITAVSDRVTTTESKLDTIQGTGTGSIAKALSDAKSYTDTQVLTEKTRAEGAEQTIAGDLATEITRAKGAESANTTAILNEVARATGIENTLSEAIATAESNIASINEDITDINNNINTVNTTLGNRIDTLSNDLTTNVNTINNNLNAVADDLAVETAARIDNYSKVVTSISNEATIARKAEKINRDNIASNKNSIEIINATLNNKVDKVSGKLLSTNDYTTAEKTKLSGIATGAEVNVQSDWNVTNTTDDAYIKNKPTNATTSTSGFMSNSDKTKLDGIEANANNYSLPVATTTTLGGIIVGTNLSVDANGKLNGTYTYTLPTATSSVLGGVKVGSNITNTAGTISLTKDNVTNALGVDPTIKYVDLDTAQTITGVKTFNNGIQLNNVPNIFSNDSTLLLGTGGSKRLEINSLAMIPYTSGYSLGNEEISYNYIYAQRYVSKIATGTSPLQVVSTTLNTNLNADLLDGKHASEFATQEDLSNISVASVSDTRFNDQNVLTITEQCSEIVLSHGVEIVNINTQLYGAVIRYDNLLIETVNGVDYKLPYSVYLFYNGVEGTACSLSIRNSDSSKLFTISMTNGNNCSLTFLPISSSNAVCTIVGDII